MANLLSWVGSGAKRLQNTVNNDIVKPIQRDVVHPAVQTYQAVQNAKPALQRADTAANKAVVGFGKGIASGAAGVGKAAIIAPAVNLLADFSKNPFVKQEAANYQTNADLQAQGLTAPILRTVPEVAATLRHPTSQFTYHPNSPLEQALFGKTPVQNIQKKVANNYDTHKNLPGWQRVGLAGLEGAGSVVQDAPVVGAAAKIAKVGDAGLAARGVKVNAGSLGLSTKDVSPPKMTANARDLQKAVQQKLPEANHLEATRLAQNIAKLDNSKTVEPVHISEAYQYRNPAELNIIRSDNLFKKSGPLNPMYDRAKQVGVKGLDPQLPKLGAQVRERINAMPDNAKQLLQQAVNMAGDRVGINPIAFDHIDSASLKNLSGVLDKIDANKKITGNKQLTPTEVAMAFSKPAEATPAATPSMALIKHPNPEAGFVDPGAIAHSVHAAANDLVNLAHSHHPQFQEALAGIAQSLGEVHKAGPVKSLERIVQKTINENAGDISKLRDAVRGTITIKNPGDLEKYVKHIGNKFEVSRVKNTMDLPRGKYRQAIVNVKLPSGIEGEVQLTTPEMQFAKKEMQGHGLYKQTRVSGANLGRLEALMNKVYGAAHDAEDKRLNSSSVISLPSAKALPTEKGLPAAVKPTASSPSRTTLTGTSSTSKNLGKVDKSGAAIPNIIQKTAKKSSKGAVKPPEPPVEKTGIAPKSGKPSRFPNVTVQRSDEVPAGVKKAAKAEKATYRPHTDAARAAAAEKWLKGKSTKTAYSEVVKAFEGNPTDQHAFNAIALAKKLSSTGHEADTALAGKIYALQGPKGSSAGQFIQAFSQLNRRTPEGLHNAAIKTLKKAKVDITPEIEKEIDTRMKVIRAAKEGSDERQIAAQDLVDYTNQQIPRTKMQAGIDYWRAGLLTGPETVAKIATSHLITSPMELIDRPLAAATDKLVSAAPKSALRFLNRNNSKAKTPGQRTVTFSPKDYGTFTKGMGRGAKAAGAHLKSGVDMPHTGGFAKDFGKGTRQSLYERTIYRVHGSVYKPFYSGAYKMEEANMRRIAEKQFGGDAKKIQEFMASPDAAKQMEDYAAQFAMQNETAPGEFTQTIQHFKPGGVPVGQWIAPFSRIPAALGVKGIVDYTPLGTVRAATTLVKGITKGEFDQRKFVESLSKSAIGGTGLVTSGYLLMNHGRMTLQAPTDPKEKALWAAQGKTKNSIKIGNKWVTLNAFGPVGLALGLGGAFARAHQAGDSGSKATEQAIASATKLLADQPYMKGLGGLTDALNNPVQKASGYVHTAVTSWIPAGVQQIARGTDQTARQYPDTLKQSIEQAIPWVREHTSGASSNPDMWGKNQPGTGRAGVVGGALGTVNPFYPSAARNQNDRPTQELQRLYNTLQSQDTPPFANPTSVTLFGNKIKLNNSQAQAMLQGTGPLIHDGISQLMSNPTYSTLNDLQKSKAITSVIDRVRQDWVAGNADSVFNASQLKDMTAKGKGATLSTDQKTALGIATPKKASTRTAKPKAIKTAKAPKAKTTKIAGTSRPKKLSASTKLPSMKAYKPIAYKTPKFTVKTPKAPSFKVAKAKRAKYPSVAIKTPKLTRKSIA